MWELNDYWGDDHEEEVQEQNSLVSPNTIIPSDVHVLLVDHDRETLASLSNMLQLNSYKVTVIELASTGLAMLSEEGEQFDVVIVNISSPDFQGFRLLETAIDKGKAAFLISTNEDLVLASRAIHRGACMCLKKPISIEFVKYLWQHVLKHRINIINGARSSSNNNNTTEGNIGKNGSISESFSDDDDQNHSTSDMEINGPIKNKNKKKKKNRKGKRKGRRYQDVSELNSNDVKSSSGHVKKKACTEWTRELHAKFMDAVTKLGEGRCYPKDILIKMNVPGLTRMQVASHLQKCRNENWRVPEKRRGQGRSRPNAGNSSLKADGMRRFGTMPRPCDNFNPPPQEHHHPSNNNNKENSCKSGFPKLNHPAGIENEEPPNGQQTVDDDYYLEFTHDMDYIAENIRYLREGSDPHQTQPQYSSSYSHNQVYPHQVQVAMGMEMEAKWLQYGSKVQQSSGNLKWGAP